MANKRVAYSCEHGCKRRMLVSKSAMEKHEKNCFRNPERKACITCKHFNTYPDSNGMDGTPYEEIYFVRECLVECKDLTKKLAFSCNHHEVKNGNS